MRLARAATAGLLLLAAACSSRAPTSPETSTAPNLGVYKLGPPYRINGRLYVPEFDPNYDRVGIASWYGDDFHARPTANGEVFDKNRLSAAHPTLPLPSRVRVTNLENGKSIELRVNDRGPFVDDRLIDLSQAAARELGFEEKGLALVRVEFLALDVAQGTPPEPTVPVARPATSDGRRELARPNPPPPRPSDPAEPPAATVRLPAGVRLASFSAEPKGESCPLGPHWVQVGAFTEEARWRAALRTLAAIDRPRIEPVLINGRAALRVRLGPAPNRGEALALAERARSLGFTDAAVLPVAERVASC
jgi:rare lipoprotein A